MLIHKVITALRSHLRSNLRIWLSYWSFDIFLVIRSWPIALN